jgi:hypothetical protein
MVKKIVTIHNKHHIATQFIESVSEVSNTAYYVFVSDQYDRASVRDITESDRDIIIDTYQNMIMGKRVTPNDVKLGARNIAYVSNTVYDMYDDQDQYLNIKNFYAIVNASSFYHIYKCLDNNGNTASTITPDISHIVGSNTDLYETSDGYRWKYLYSVSSATKQKFATTDYFPVVSNSSVTNTAINGAINLIKVIDGGKRYDNYLEGTFTTSQIKVNGNSVLYEISNTNINTANSFYSNCLIYISNGTGVGQYKKISSYFSNANGNYVVVNSEFTTVPTNGSEYEIYPFVNIIGSGQTINAIARAITNASSSNSIYKIEMMNIGKDYNFHSATIEVSNVISSSNTFKQANVRPIYSPPGGHGSSIENELYSKNMIISVEFANSESNTILTTNKFNQVGLLKDPLFNNVNLRLTTVSGDFTSGEKIIKINPTRININAISNSSTSNVTCSAADFENQLDSGDVIFIRTSTDSDHFIHTVNAITNSSQITLTANAKFTTNNAWIYLANVSSNGYLSDIKAANSIVLSNVQGIFQTNDLIIGQNSGAIGTVTTIFRNDVAKSFNTYIQLNKFTGNLISGTFNENEIIYQGNLTTANATLHSIINTSSNGILLYVSNTLGSFSFGNVGGTSYTVIGNNSLAIAHVSNSYSGELVYGSGEILYLNNIEAVERNETQKETFKIIFEF